MKQYYVDYYRDFSNTYSLCWADGSTGYPPAGSGWTRTNRAEALRLARAERWRRKCEHSMSGYADADIRPYDYNVQAVLSYCRGDLLTPDDVEPVILVWRDDSAQAAGRAAAERMRAEDRACAASYGD